MKISDHSDDVIIARRGPGMSRPNVGRPGGSMNAPSSNVEWKRWGETDPLWAVSSWPGKQKGAGAAWTEDEFIALGASDWADFVEQWRQYGLSTRACVEVGCGAGRITRQLAGTFERVLAVDVSEGMIARAKRIAPNGNIEYALVSGLELPQSGDSATAVFSAHVLQHLNSYEDGLTYFREFHRVLSAGGTLMVHLPVYLLPREQEPIGRCLEWGWSAYRVLDGALSTTRRWLGRPLMRGTQYGVERLRRDLDAIGFQRIEVRMFETASNGSLHPFVMATKS
jgi:ubiquinone/menaquinone biosynthesis C-methylase UbiE